MIKKYSIRLLASIPMLAVGISAILAFAFSIDYPILILLGIGLGLSFISCAARYEATVKEVRDLFRVLTDNTITYE